MFESAKLKLERADKHIAEIEAEFAVFVEKNPHRLSIKANPDDGNLYVDIIVGANQIPDNISLAMGDAIHNIRTAFDHMTWDIVGRDNGTQDRYLKLPTGNNRVNFDASCEGLKTPSQDVKTLFKSLEVFPDGLGNQIYLIHQLDNADKHTVLTPAVRATTISGYRVVNPDGSVVATMKNITLIGGDGGQMGLAKISGGLSIELENDTTATPEIFFKDIAGFHAHRVVPTLRNFSKASLETLNIVERRCRAIWGI